ncbi:YunG family protein [Actinocorallia longicatena]|uniref:Uncharacterized protein n=1 Tax=Actinocorallia longicatena TaxID=111803 RepID=A0ABP6QPD9_9ACTN
MYAGCRVRPGPTGARPIPLGAHCDITALIVNDLLGGDLMLGDVHQWGRRSTRRYHYWNRLDSELGGLVRVKQIVGVFGGWCCRYRSPLAERAQHQRHRCSVDLVTD